MIKAQKPEEISFAFTAVGRDQLFILRRWGRGKLFAPTSAQGGFLQAKPRPQSLNSK